jgi:hypothetical protein
MLPPTLFTTVALALARMPLVKATMLPEFVTVREPSAALIPLVPPLMLPRLFTVASPTTMPLTPLPGAAVHIDRDAGLVAGAVAIGAVLVGRGARAGHRGARRGTGRIHR